MFPNLSICMPLQHFGCTQQKCISCSLDPTLFLFDFVCECKHHNQRLTSGLLKVFSYSKVLQVLFIRLFCEEILLSSMWQLVKLLPHILVLDCNVKTWISPPPQLYDFVILKLHFVAACMAHMFDDEFVHYQELLKFF